MTENTNRLIVLQSEVYVSYLVIVYIKTIYCEQWDAGSVTVDGDCASQTCK